MVAPRLCTPLILEEAERVSDGMGGHGLHWRPVARLWAELKSGSGRERGGEVGPVSVANWRITLRGARPGDPRRPRPGQRLRMAGRFFLIDAVTEDGADGRWLTCFAHEEN
ncbi:head-tail adaptor protein [Paracoccus sp. TK19116]|uniref:Head-tail adaptor protein n=1 Tax=Paracoccus albicereus TaxID=2922394 RepID=A0ABT1MUA0_9RHOB|nr:head-tail adaptor protein [Paracoccus albicereus]MCQ0971885.1 head-tail adaptor protein [Paracoccus albicereus]